ncbi:MAG TPA: hypothetical protein DCX79_02110 [Planctomycetaceae bacterium]|nr:hypothetical protein [Planctomycetaceae bacterium]
MQAFDGDGQAFARYVLYQKLSTAWRRMMVNTADSPMMKILDSFTEPAARTSTGRKNAVPATEPATPGGQEQAQTGGIETDVNLAQ